MPSQFYLKVHGAAVAFMLKESCVFCCSFCWEEALPCSRDSPKLATTSRMAASFPRPQGRCLRAPSLCSPSISHSDTF